jgi:hypothetical protein
MLPGRSRERARTPTVLQVPRSEVSLPASPQMFTDGVAGEEILETQSRIGLIAVPNAAPRAYTQLG